MVIQLSDGLPINRKNEDNNKVVIHHGDGPHLIVKGDNISVVIHYIFGPPLDNKGRQYQCGYTSFLWSSF